jgi:16S rRNA (uracil1498-N3)-methyltransferase
MKIHRFYIGDKIELKHDFWLHDEEILMQWNKVLRFRPGQKIVLFDGERTDRLYEITEITIQEAHLKMSTDLNRRVPDKEVYLLWSLLKKDKNDWIIQKGTELGVSNFVPIISERCDRTDVSSGRIDRWRKISIEASEQSGRSDVPYIREPLNLSKALEEYNNKILLLVADEEGQKQEIENEQVGVLIGPEGGWSDSERQIFENMNIENINIGEFTLRAETAAVIAVSKLIK